MRRCGAPAARVPRCGVGAQGHGAGVVGHCFDFNSEVRKRNAPGCVFGPFGQLEARAREDVAEAGVLPFARIAEAIEVEMEDRQPVGRLVRLDHRVGRALDAPGDAERAQQVAHEGGLAGAEVALQRDEGVAQRGRARQRARQRVGVVFGAPDPGGAVRFYNRQVIGSHQLVNQDSGLGPGARILPNRHRGCRPVERRGRA